MSYMPSLSGAAGTATGLGALAFTAQSAKAVKNAIQGEATATPFQSTLSSVFGKPSSQKEVTVRHSVEAAVYALPALALSGLTAAQFDPAGDVTGMDFSSYNVSNLTTSVSECINSLISSIVGSGAQETEAAAEEVANAASESTNLPTFDDVQNKLTDFIEQLREKSPEVSLESAETGLQAGGLTLVAAFAVSALSYKKNTPQAMFFKTVNAGPSLIKPAVTVKSGTLAALGVAMIGLSFFLKDLQNFAM